jgi:hypothetical protein
VAALTAAEPANFRRMTLAEAEPHVLSQSLAALSTPEPPRASG